MICATCFIKIESIDKFAQMANKTEETYLTWIRKAKERSFIVLNSNIPKPCNITSPIIDDRQSINHHKVILKTYRNPRNPRHVDHITLEQIINDQIVKNPKSTMGQTLVEISPVAHSTILSGDGPCPNSSESMLDQPNISIIAYHDLKIGQLIKDEQLLRLMLKALRWMETSGSKRSSNEYWLKKLRQSKFRDILSNPNLLSDSDLMQLIKSYVGPDALTFFNCNPTSNIPPASISIIPTPPSIYKEDLDKLSTTILQPSKMVYDENSVTQMEVGVDPALFLPDEESSSMTKTSTTPVLFSIEQIQNNGRFLCTMCSETFTLNTDLQNHVLVHLLNQTNVKLEKTSENEKKQKRKRRRKQELKPIRGPPVAEEPVTTQITKITSDVLINIERRGRKPKKDNQDPRLECPTCKKRLSTKGNLKVHINTHKLKVKEMKIDAKIVAIKRINKAKKPSPEPSSLLSRQKTGSKLSKFPCESCSRTFASKGSLSIHLLSHALEKQHTKRHKCQDCKKIFEKQRDLKVNIIIFKNFWLHFLFFK